MDYLQESFGRFAPHVDADAALKLSLDALVTDKRIDDIVALLTADSSVGGIEGEPGWIIERRENGEVRGYEDWPKDACFRAYVNPKAYLLRHPIFYCDKMTFHKYLQSIVDVYARRFPGEAQAIRTLRQLISRGLA